MRMSMMIPRLTLAAATALGVLTFGVGAARASIGEIGSFGTTGPGALAPYSSFGGIADDPNTGDVYVADTQHQRVVKYDPSGDFILTFGREVDATKVSERHKEEEKGEPVTVGETEEDICTAASGDECQDGAVGSGPEQFDQPGRVTVDPTDDDLYVGDSLSVKKFNAEGRYISQIVSGVGAAPAEPAIEPGGPMAVDLEGNLYIAAQSWVVNGYQQYGFLKFTPSGAYTGVQFVTTAEEVPEQWHGRYRSIAVTENGLYVVKNENISETPLLKFNLSSGHYVEGFEGIGGNGVAADLLTGDLFTTGGEYNPEGSQILTGGWGGAMAYDAKDGMLYQLTEAIGEAPTEVVIYGPFPVPAAKAPVVAGESSSGYGVASATITARVNPDLAATTYYFQYGTSSTLAGAASVPVAPAEVGSGYLSVTESAELSGLQPSTTYYYRAIVHSAFGGGAGSTAMGPIQSFRTAAPLPSVSVEGVSEVSYDAATVQGTVNPGSVGSSSDTRWCFQYGTGSGGGYNLGSLPLSAGDAGQGTADVPVTLRLTDLEPGSTYRYRLVAVNSLGLGLGSTACGTEGGHESDSAEASFTTPITLPAPSAVTGAASGVAQNAAVIAGTVNPDGVSTSYEFQLGLDTSYGAEVFGEAGAGSEAEAFSLSLTNLQPDTTYHYRLVAISAGGTSYGADASFTTGGFASAALTAPVAPPLVATPLFAFPSAAAVVAPAGKKATGKKAKKKRKGVGRKRKSVGKKGSRARRAVRAGGSGHRRAGKRRSGR
jgi:hypothetical protein